MSTERYMPKLKSMVDFDGKKFLEEFFRQLKTEHFRKSFKQGELKKARDELKNVLYFTNGLRDLLDIQALFPPVLNTANNNNDLTVTDEPVDDEDFEKFVTEARGVLTVLYSRIPLTQQEFYASRLARLVLIPHKVIKQWGGGAYGRRL